KKMPLSWAAYHGDIPAIDALLQAGSPINHSDYMGRTALYWAIHAGKTNCADHLIAKGADLHQISANNGRNFLHIAADTCNHEALNLLLKLKVNPLHRDFEGKTVVHQAAASGFTPSLEILDSHGVDLKVLDQDGKNALHWTARFGSEECLDFLITKGLDPFQKDTLGKTPLDDAILTGNLAAIQHLFPLFAKSPEALQNPLYLTKFWIKSELAYQKDISDWIYDQLSESQRQATIPLIEKIWHWKSFTQQEAGHIVTKPSPESSHLLIDLMPYLMTSEHLETLKPQIKKVETQFDYNPDKRHYHPNEAEFLLLLKHPDALTRDPKHIGFLTTALTGMTRFINPPTVTLSDSVVKAWGDIGFLSHAFRFWRFDSTKTKTGGPDDSLLTQFGFKPLHSSTPLNQEFGKGFGYFDPDTGNRFEFRRGFLLAAHPDHGTLIIRNSSKHFGRDLLKHPAYFLPYALSEKDLETIDLKQIKDQYHILNRSLYETPDNNLHIPYLTQALMGLKEEYRRFKFDTQGFEGIGVNRVFTGHHAPGLPKMVSFLQKLHEQGKPLPHLAFVNPDYPIYKPYGIFPLTPDHFKELTDFVTGQWTHPKYPQSQWIEFIHKYGVETRGELVMLDSQGPVPEIVGN
ncbi:MAG: ankyrin repeat domain-containing protein, partial [Cyanobacteria bacterium]|nr:ankyrin repeat domain-containing protein [Cyanobacteriota bacterium]